MYIEKSKESLSKKKFDKFIEQQEKLDKYYSDKQLGTFVHDGKTFFRLFTPNATDVVLCTFINPEDSEYKEFKMTKDEDGVWETTLEGELYGLFYGYKVYHKNSHFDSDEVICLDPYAKSIATFTDHFNTPRRSMVYKSDYDWEGDDYIRKDWRDLIVYEMHIRDMTIHPTSGVEKAGTYHGLTEKGKTGGLDYIKSLGINTVELLPSQDFGNCEIPYEDSLMGRYNEWNPYERNHWGYMTAGFFAPESYYAEDWKEFKWKTWKGKSGKQVNAFKDMVKAFHKEGIAVIMDVVYNHISEYEIGNLKEIDKEYYFRLDPKGNFISQSYCGNDFKTERPMARRMIVESILYWMKEYHIDGFRFDLGKMIDWMTVEEIIREAKKVNPHVIIVCEPWGGGYDPAGFSLRGWGSWNDQIRNGIKGENPFNALGWIFGKWYGNNNIKRVKSYVNGTLVRDSLGLFQKKEHSVNYLESHDGYTLSDFIRIGLKETDPEKVIEDIYLHTKLTAKQTKLNKLAAMFLFTSQGIIMIHSGQEYARSKVIPWSENSLDKHAGMIDHNTYNKDNEVNYINYDHAKLNSDLLEYYRGLIAIRNEYAAFRRAAYDEITFAEIPGKEFALGYVIVHDKEELVVLFNASHSENAEFTIPEGNWSVIANIERADIKGISKVSENVKLEPISGYILRKEK